MLAIELDFLTGRFHATPWGRNVNEGVPEWPPSPYRLIRGLYDVWKRKLDEWPVERVEPVFEALASEPPVFQLPRANASHTRSFLSENTKEITDKQLIFDAFVVILKGSPLLMMWPNTDLTQTQKDDLDRMLSQMNYLGRSESWVDAKVLSDAVRVRWNCAPDYGSPSHNDLEMVKVACPVSVKAYNDNPYINQPRTKKEKPHTLSWMDALAFTTADMHTNHLSVPPAFQYVIYQRSSHCFNVTPSLRTKYADPGYTGVIYALESRVTPSVTATIEVSERIHRKLMGIHKRVIGDAGNVSSLFSGKEPEGIPMKGHQHIYVLPLDQDNDGWLDHLVIVSKIPFNHSERVALDRLNQIWQPDGKPDIFFVPLKWGQREDFADTRTLRQFQSSTPFVPPRHYRKGRGPLMEWLTSEVRREALNHGLPEPVSVIPLERLSIRNDRTIRWLEFRRNRKGDPDKMGYGFEITFPEPVAGPIALGYGAHFGLGQFIPVRD